MNDAEETSFFVIREEGGEVTIAGAKYKKEGGSKTDLQTGERIRFNILEDGSHEETRRFPKEDDEGEPPIPAEALTLARRVKALVEKGDRAAEKAEQFYKSAGLHIKEIKQKYSEHWEIIVRDRCGLGRSRAYELMAIADGRTTLERVRAGATERQKIRRAKSSVTSRTPEPGSEEYERDRAECVALFQKALDAEREHAEWLVDDIVSRAIAAVAAMNDEQRRQFHDRYIKLYGAAQSPSATPDNLDIPPPLRRSV
jgi:hypothetical protein